jgi:hypothetical protein
MLPAIIARIRDTPAVREQENKYGPGIMPRWDADGNVTQIVFSDTYTREMADSWLANHGYSGYSLDEQTRENEDEAKPFTRALSFDFQQIGGKFEDLPSGGLIVRGVKLLAAGIWTDSAQGTPLEYSSDVLQRYAGNWLDSAMWSRHSGGVPRNITEKVGEVLNQRYENEAVVGDLHYHGLTQQSRDTIAMVKAGQANFVSVEHGGKEKWNPGRRIYQAEELTFTGIATVNRGACARCTIRDNEAGEQPAEPETEVENMDTETITKELEAVKADVSGLKTAFEANQNSVKELSEAIKGLTDKLEENKELSARLEALENQPAPAATNQPKELEALPEYFVPVSRKSGIVGA